MAVPAKGLASALQFARLRAVVVSTDISWGWDWNAISALANVALLFAAGFAAFQVNKQIKQLDTQHAAQLSAARRPFLIVTADEIQIGPGAPKIPAVRNIGVGPALNVVGEAWVAVVVPPPLGTSMALVELQLNAALQAAKSGAPHFRMRFGGIGVDESTEDWLPEPNGPRLVRGNSFGFAYKITYNDVANKHYVADSAATGRIL